MVQGQESSQVSRKRAEARRRLLLAGLEVIGATSLAEARVAEITQLAGVGKGTFFTHFATKDQFVARLVDHIFDGLAGKVAPLGLHADDAVDLLARVGAVHLRFFQLRPEAASVLAQALALAGEAGDEARARLRRHLEMVIAKIGPAAQLLGWPAAGLEDLALTLLAGACGLPWFGRALGGRRPADPGLPDRLARALARGLAAEKRGG